MRLPDWTKRIASNLSFAGVLVGAIFFALSLTPSLLPRTALIQGVLSGCLFAVGYALGALLEWILNFLELRLPRGRFVVWLKGSVAAISVLLVGLFLAKTSDWQNEVRAAMGQAPVEYGHPVFVVLVALVPATILIVIGTLLSHAVQGVSRRLIRIVPPRVAALGALLIVGVLTALLFSGVLLRGGLRAADRFFEGLDMVAGQFGDPPPADPLSSGSEASLIDWSTIGRDGRDYVRTRPTAAEISSLTGRPAAEPGRVYVGLRSAPTTEERAELALAELVRIGAFERRALVIIMPVGTGWVDPPSIKAVEYLLDGDVASVSLQYSYLVSPLSLVIEPDYGKDAAEALFDAVYRYWTRLPRETRPRLYLGGLSLGAQASQSSTQFFDIFADPIQGALWVGPPFTSPIWRWATRNRQPDSPHWLPRFGDDSSIRFTNGGSDLSTHPGVWGPLRIAFLQYPSDPIVFFDADAWYREPEWMAGKPGPGVPDTITWYPVVTFFQLAMDMALSNASPSGYGHVYSPEDYVESWFALLEPEGWDATRLDVLKALLATKTGRE